HKSPDGWHTLHPPDPVSHGPAHAPERASTFKPATGNPSRDGPAPPRRTSNRRQNQWHEPLFTLG
ncbi:MAG: hypothetical protein J4F50_09785, partial [Acidimicrobiia bacterium]|nr:hypothetical protein [Acidimicrobiia bacterium]